VGGRRPSRIIDVNAWKNEGETSKQLWGITDIQGDSGGKVNILGGDSISHCEKRSFI
jgi:hypothetical protein